MVSNPATTTTFLIQPSDDPALRESFLAAMAEHEAADGRPDADGLTLADLRTEMTAYTEGLRDGTALRPGTDPMLATVWWCVEDAEETAGREYLGRVSIRHHPATATLGERGSQIWVSVRPSRRGQGHGRTLLEAALPFAAANGITKAVIEVETRNEAARRLVVAAGARPIEHEKAELNGRRRYVLPTI